LTFNIKGIVRKQGKALNGMVLPTTVPLEWLGRYGSKDRKGHFAVSWSRYLDK